MLFQANPDLKLDDFNESDGESPKDSTADKFDELKSPKPEPKKSKASINKRNMLYIDFSKLQSLGVKRISSVVKTPPVTKKRKTSSEVEENGLSYTSNSTPKSSSNYILEVLDRPVPEEEVVSKSQSNSCVCVIVTAFFHNFLTLCVVNLKLTTLFFFILFLYSLIWY